MDNWLVAVVAGAFLLGLIIGIARGAIKITVSLLATIVTFVLVFFLTPYVSKGITKMTPAQDVLETKIESTIAGDGHGRQRRRRNEQRRPDSECAESSGRGRRQTK